MIDFRQKLAEREARHLYRRRRTSDGPQGPLQQIDGREFLSFCSNDYLGLANHPEIVAAFKHGVDSYGVGSGAAHLVNGHSRAHQALEEELAAFTQRPRALLFSTGYMANLGTVAALVGAGDALFEDRLNHASLLDAGLLSRARLSRYDHGDVASVQNKLSDSSAAQKLIVTDGLFSMDGDIAPLPELAAAARRHDAMLMVDDAHAFGVLGPQGRGSCAHFALGSEAVPVLMATLGKGVGTFGAFVAGSEELIEWLIQTARPYIFTTATPPAIAEATRASLRIIQTDEWRREKLQTLIRRFREGAAQLGLPLMTSETPIQPLLVGTAADAVAMSQRLEGQGILISAIRPPTVPEGTARLRITLSAAHSEGQVDRLLAALESACA
ncbi:MAG: 8-amino-7-oxononanoate synthase [Gammaproteobacteria bacterium]|nr:8-amino-7-oxononanoate synthase [Gammaproteobacteria bacterium]